MPARPLPGHLAVLIDPCLAQHQQPAPTPLCAPRCFRYGTPQPFVSYFAPSRGGGESAFGILEWGGCGYTNSEGGQPSLTWPKELVAAYSDSNDDSAGERAAAGPAADCR